MARFSKKKRPVIIHFTSYQKDHYSRLNLKPILYDYDDDYVHEIENESAEYGHAAGLRALENL